MEKKYQVFISSTYSDLQNERAQIIQALLELDCIPTGMELFQAANDDQWNWIKRAIDGCDYFIVVIAGCYGTIHPVTQMSYTEMEYRYALERHIPTIGFLYKSLGNLPVNKSETDENRARKLKQFRDFVSQKLINFWENPHELKADVTLSMIKLIQHNPAVGWIRGDNVAKFIQDVKIQDSNGTISDDTMHEIFFKSVNDIVKQQNYYISRSDQFQDNTMIYTLTLLDNENAEPEYLFIGEDAYRNFFVTPEEYRPQYIKKEVTDKSFDSPDDKAFIDFFLKFLSKRFHAHFDIIDRSSHVCKRDAEGKVIALGGGCDLLNKKIGKYEQFFKNEEILNREDVLELFALPNMKRGRFLYDKVDRIVNEWIKKQNAAH